MMATFQHPFYPYCGTRKSAAHMCNVPLPAGARGDAFRQVFGDIDVPRCAAQPADDLGRFRCALRGRHGGSLGLLEADLWATKQIKDVAEDCGHKRIVSILEGGYSLSSLARSVVAHIKDACRILSRSFFSTSPPAPPRGHAHTLPCVSRWLHR